MRLLDLLDKGAIITTLDARQKREALEEMVGILSKAGKISDPSAALRALVERETRESTALGQGVALPRAGMGGLMGPVALLAISQKGVDFGAVDGRPVHLLFLFLTPLEATELHLQLLATASATFTDRTLYRHLLEAKGPAAVLSLLLHHEKGGKEVFFPLPVERIYEELRTDPSGLSEDEAGRRLERYGPNLLREVRGKPLLLRFAENLYNLLAILLWIGGILAFVADMPQLGWAIFAVIVVNAVFSFWQEYRAERALEALKRLLPRKASVVRGGKVREIPAEELVPGDILLVEEGDSISADARLIESFDMRVDNSALTGESRPVHKAPEPVADGKEFLWMELPNLVFAGTTVASGAGRAAVIATGMHTEIGRIAALTQELREEPSPLQKELAGVTKVVTVLALGMGVLFFFLGTTVAGLTTASAFLFAIGIIVANVPEGLLPTVTISLAMAVQRMARRNAIIKRLSAVETLGSTTVICSDKTGTLTTNELTVTRIWFNGRPLEVSGARYEPAGNFYSKGMRLSREEMKREGMDLLLDAAVLCNNAGLLPPGKGEGWRVVGDPTEGALLVLAAKGGTEIEARRRFLPRVGQLPFDAIRKRMTSIHIMDGRPTAWVKGAPRETLELCTGVLMDGRVVPLTHPLREEILVEIDSQAGVGLRVLGLAYRPLGFAEGFVVENTERDLVFLGLVGMTDPPRPEVPEAISMCHRAGIKVIMITGDYGLTALSIAREIGLARAEKTRVVTGLEVSAMGEEDLKRLLKEEVIFARVSPEHKMQIVTALKEMGEVVAVTGDGVNDAPALKKADIGIAMGMRGSDVAREAAAMILTDDNFATIVAAIEEGRAVYANIKKFVTYIFASNIPEVVPFIAFVLLKVPLPLTVMQILAVDVGTDLVPALALGAEPPEPGIMERPPRPRGKRLLDMPLLLRAYGFLGPIEAMACMAGYLFVYLQSGWRPGMAMPGSGVVYLTATTMTLAGIVATQIGNVFACRTERESVFKVGLFSNRLVLLGIASELAIISALIYIPPLREVFGLAPLGPREWAFLLAFAPLLLMVEEVRKGLVRRWRPLHGP